MLPQTQEDILAEQLILPNRVPFERLEDTFALAADKAGGMTLQRQYQIAGYPVQVRIVGERLAQQVEAALTHLSVANPRADALCIDLWDQQATGIAWDITHERTNDVLIMMRATEDGRFVCEERPQGEHWLDRTKHRIIGSTTSADQRHLDERARPFHKLLATWLNDRGIQFIHSGLIEVAGKGLLFAGHGGAGKSTTSISCLQSGYQYLGDDFIGIEPNSNGAFVGYGLYASGLLCTDHLERFPDLVPYTHPPFHTHEEKAVFYVADRFPDAMRHKVDISAIALPKVVNRRHTSYTPASRVEALLALAPTSVMLLPVPSAKAFHMLAQLVETVPVYWLELGSDIDRIPDAVKQLADEVA